MIKISFNRKNALKVNQIFSIVNLFDMELITIILLWILIICFWILVYTLKEHPFYLFITLWIAGTFLLIGTYNSIKIHNLDADLNSNSLKYIQYCKDYSLYNNRFIYVWERLNKTIESSYCIFKDKEGTLYKKTIFDVKEFVNEERCKCCIEKNQK